MSDKAILTCALTGVLTNPAVHNVPVTPEEMADAAEQAWNEGAVIVHCHFRDQREGMGHLPTWDVNVVGSIIAAIKERTPEMIINMSTGIGGPDISGPAACLEAHKPDLAACNAGTLNYLKLKSDGTWAWPPHIFDNPVEKVQRFLDVMKANNVIPEFECFDTGIVRSVALYKKAGMFEGDPHISLVMGVASGQAAKASWLPLLKEEMLPGTHWQVIAVGTFYLPNGDKARNNGDLVKALADLTREVGREPATASEARQILGIKN
ncbi:MAG: 3-keto-5-aminohexanoate cleavage protein [Deltaproteobacteria bacterium]|nr:3-keto-5-aminohexanoate cleavage protein [Deltaproteobacteria bacterium]